MPGDYKDKNNNNREPIETVKQYKKKRRNRKNKHSYSEAPNQEPIQEPYYEGYYDPNYFYPYYSWSYPYTYPYPDYGFGNFYGRDIYNIENVEKTNQGQGQGQGQQQMENIEDADNSVSNVFLEMPKTEQKGGEPGKAEKEECKCCMNVLDISTRKSCNYCKWKENHEIEIEMPAIIDIEKPFFFIKDRMASIRDLIAVIEKYEYDEKYEYNINLKALHNIHIELKELNGMVGLENLKQSIFQQIIYFLQDLQDESGEYKHTVLYGPPGTGKTEIAMIIGRMFSKIGILKNASFKKVCRNDLIAGFLGQTAMKTKRVIEESIGGVLFIDEAYSLAPNTDESDIFSKECIDILCESLSDHKKDLMVIIAGYEEEIKNTLFRMNRGIESRFIWQFTIDPYKAGEMKSIFHKKVLDIKWTMDAVWSPSPTITLDTWFGTKMKDFPFYGRDMEFLLIYIKIVHSIRVFGEPTETKKKITWKDMNDGFEMFLQNKNKTKKPDYMNSIYV